jgi:tetratricopeptide (TPR) repeat protein
MTEEKFTAISSPAPAASPQASRPASGRGWLSRVFSSGRGKEPTGVALALPYEPPPAQFGAPPGGTRGAGAAQALARASGLTAHSASGPVLTALAVVLGVALVGSVVYFYRSQFAAGGSAASSLNLVDADDKLLQLLQAAEQARARGDNPAAIRSYEQAVQIKPHNTALLTNLARLYRNAGQDDSALQVYSRLVELDGKNLEARLQRGMVYWVRGEWAEADREFRQLIRLAPDSEQATAALSMLDQGAAPRPAGYARRGRSSPAGPNLPLADAGYSVPMSLTQLALSAHAAPPVSSGSSAAEEGGGAQALAEASLKRGHSMLRHGLYDSAIDAYKRAGELTPENKDINYHIASAYKRAGQDARAHEYYKKCEDSTYSGTCRDGIKRTRKAAQEEAKKQQSQQKSDE